MAELVCTMELLARWFVGVIRKECIVFALGLACVMIPEGCRKWHSVCDTIEALCPGHRLQTKVCPYILALVCAAHETLPRPFDPGQDNSRP